MQAKTKTASTAARWGVWCIRHAHSMLGYRAGWLISDGQPVVFEAEPAANKKAAELNNRAQAHALPCSYSPRTIPGHALAGQRGSVRAEILAALFLAVFFVLIATRAAHAGCEQVNASNFDCIGTPAEVFLQPAVITDTGSTTLELALTAEYETELGGECPGTQVRKGRKVAKVATGNTLFRMMWSDFKQAAARNATVVFRFYCASNNLTWAGLWPLEPNQTGQNGGGTCCPTPGYCYC